MLKAAHYKVNEIHQDQRPSCSTTSICRSATQRFDRRSSRFTDQHRDDRQPLQAELGATAPNITANTTRRSTRTSGCTSTISEMHDDVSTNAASVAMKKKYAAIKSMSKSMETQTQLSSHSMSAMLQISTPTTTLKGPQHSQGRSEHFSGPVFLKSLGSIPTMEG